MPFYDNALIELSMLLPGALRAKSYIYNKYCCIIYPDSLHYPLAKIRRGRFPVRIMPEKLFPFANVRQADASRRPESRGLPVHDRRNFTSQREKSIREPGRSFLKNYLLIKMPAFRHI